MASYWCLVVCVVTLVGPLVTAYPNGPPIVMGQNNPVCEDGMPHHDHLPSKTAADGLPYYVEVTGNCYRYGMQIPVYVRTDPAGDQPYFEGMFVQARRWMTPAGKYDLTTNVGTFSTDDPTLGGRPCFNKENSAISQIIKEHWTCKKFTWAAPSAGEDTIQFNATIVRKKAIFWVGIVSSELKYDANCPEHPMSADICITTEASPDEKHPAAGSDVLHAIYSITLIVASMATLFNSM